MAHIFNPYIMEQLSTHAALPEDPSLVSGTHVKGFPTPRSLRDPMLFSELCGHSHTHTETEVKINIKT